jgi:dynein heavy chain, axonemal
LSGKVLGLVLQNPVVVETVNKLVDKWIDALTEHKRLNCKELVGVDRLAAVAMTTRLFDALATPENGADPADPASFPGMLENWFIFCLIWGIGGSLDDSSRKTFDGAVREMDTRFPTANTVFDYVIDANSKAWVPWESRLSAAFRPPVGAQAFRVLVPTADTLRHKFLVGALVRRCHHVLMTGGVGVGKTLLAQALLDELPDDRTSMIINFSAQTSANSLQVLPPTLIDI